MNPELRFPTSEQLVSRLRSARAAAWLERCLPAGFVLLSVVVVVLRRPDAVLDAQFWAEDGALWFAQAYNGGIWSSLTIRIVGYYQSLCRIAGALAQLLPFAWVPLFFNCIAIVVQLLPAWLLLTPRFSRSIPLRARLLAASLYLLLPNSWEVHANLTNAKWHLALVLFMVIVGSPSSRRLSRIFDGGVVLLGSLSGPFGLLLLPFVAIYAWRRPHPWRWLLVGLLSVGSSVQLVSLLAGDQAREAMVLGATPALLTRIVGGRVLISLFIGENGYSAIQHSEALPVLAGLLLVLASLLAVRVFWRGPLVLRVFAGFACAILAGALVSPEASSTMPQWEALTIPGCGGRYWFFPMLAIVGTIVWLVCSPTQPRPFRGIGFALLVAMIPGIVLDFRYPPYIDENFQYYAKKLEAAEVGERVDIPINPPGWTVTLKKRDAIRW